MALHANYDVRNSAFNSVSGDQVIYNSRDVLDRLEPVRMDASRRTACHPNTRVDILKFVVDWANDARNEQRMLWIHGPAGSGKSTLSTTIANLFRDSGQLGAFLFFDRDITERSDPMTVVRTLAHQLGTSDELPSAPLFRGTRTCWWRHCTVSFRSSFAIRCRI
ncbi:hypothetical protein PILCRDRAFT_640905 [Piloderma croceum F 1598]|uniref:Nephrocystin 3-like N-terminal domain-containing protein n=1 Tax=Piloderma croceum (strain F 1598) TaxID=765440 RepID=A0A0C3FA21_PILCF|nr:hypothetical protein PILCRDRAFT_640905 [Piloderma croceum F 1598]